MDIHHQGFLTDSIEKAWESFFALGFTKTGSLTKDNDRGIFIQFIQSKNGQLIELISPFRDDSVVSSLIKKRVNQIYHTCYIVNDIRTSISELEQKGFFTLEKPKYAPALGTEVAFLFSPETGIIELTNKKAIIK